MKFSIDTATSTVSIHDELVSFEQNTAVEIASVISNFIDFTTIEFDLETNTFSGFVVTERALNSSKKVIKSEDEILPDDVTYSAPIPKFTKGKKPTDLLKIIEDRYRSTMLTSIVSAANNFTAPLTAKYPQVVQAGFDKKQSEALSIISAFKKKGDVDKAIAETNMILEIKDQAKLSNEQVVGLCERIILKAREYSKVSVAVEMMQSEAETAIEAAKGIEALHQLQKFLNQRAGDLATQFGLGT